MKKIHLIVQSKDREEALERLREKGVLHVDTRREQKRGALHETAETVRRLEEALEYLKDASKNIVQEPVSDWKLTVDEVLRIRREMDEQMEGIQQVNVLIKFWEPWGDFHPGDIKLLAEKDIHLQLVQGPAAQCGDFPEGVIFQEISRTKGVIRGVALSRKPVKLNAPTVKPPKKGLHAMSKERDASHLRFEEGQSKLDDLARYFQALDRTRQEFQDQLEFETIASGMEEDGPLALLRGFVPEDVVSALETEAAASRWGLLVEDPAEDDDVPTLIRNPKPVELSKPVFQLIEVIPGYREADVSLVFLVFFTLFFGMLIGDAAYGAIFALGTFWAQRKLGGRFQDKKPFYLMYLLTGFTMFWGILTGTYFGQKWIQAHNLPLVPWLNNEANIQWMCFTVALVHLNIARVWVFLRKWPSVTAWSEAGWLMIIWGMYFLVNMFLLGTPFPAAAKWLFIAGIPLAFIFMHPPKEMPKKAGMELIPFGLNVIGAGTDIVSYIRLFAVGLATVAVADAANAMPNDMGAAGYVFLVILHAINMILAAMAILVHAIRLNVLEFSGHLNLEWAGIPYTPFRKTAGNNA